MKTLHRLCYLLLTVLFLQGCSLAVGKKFAQLEPVEPELSHVYLLRVEGGKSFDQGGSGTTGAFPDIAVNGQDIGSLKRGGYLFTKVPPGKVVLKTLDTLSWWPSPLVSREFQAEKGRRYFFKLSTSYGGQTTDRRRVVVVGLDQVPEAEAIPFLMNLQLP